MIYTLDASQCRDLANSSTREWILTNGIGGYAMGTPSGINTRRYHGHLIAAVRPPVERSLLLAGIEATVQADGAPIGLSANQYPGAVNPQGYLLLESFSVGDQAVWNWASGSLHIEKRHAMVQGENASRTTYRNLGNGPVLLTLRPLVCHRDHHANSFEQPGYPAQLEFHKTRTEIGAYGLTLVLSHPGAQRMPVQGWYYRFEHQRELERGLEPRDDLYCPCELRYELLPGEEAVIEASLKPAAPAKGSKRAVSTEMSASKNGSGSPGTVLEALKEAAAKYIVRTSERTTILAGYPWFTDWGRDTMISLPGICLRTGRIDDARAILRGYAAKMNHGLIPNRFVEGGGADYNTADASLWFLQAVHATLEAEWDREFAEEMLAAAQEIFRWHMKGTLFGIRVDPADGLLSQGEEGFQLTWMDAKIGDWVVTPRHGKPVEVNGLWINGLRVLEHLAARLDDLSDAVRYRTAAEKAESSFHLKFWCESRGHYFDTVDPNDASLRPNQLIAMSLPFGPATGKNAKRALKLIEKELLTTLGLRTLGPNEPGYRGRFKGPLSELDAAYHQGTVWPWLLGPYCSASIRVTGSSAAAKKALVCVEGMLSECGLGGIAECYDGDPPHTPGGCPWQAWSVGEVLRAWVEVASADGPPVFQKRATKATDNLAVA